MQPAVMADGNADGAAAITVLSPPSAASTAVDGIMAVQATWDEKSLLGTGGFGNVYKGQWQGNVVAVKKFHADPAGLTDDEFKESFMREKKVFAQTANRFSNVVKYLGFNLEEKYIVMELVPEARTLRKVFHEIQQKRNVPMRDRLRIMFKVANGCKHLHDNNITHKDLKPENVLPQPLHMKHQVASRADSVLQPTLRRSSVRQ